MYGRKNKENENKYEREIKEKGRMWRGIRKIEISMKVRTRKVKISMKEGVRKICKENEE